MEKNFANLIPKELMLRGIIAQNLKNLRERHGLTQEELAKCSGINRVTITKYETCKMSMRLESLLTIAKALDETPDAILKGWDEVF